MKRIIRLCLAAAGALSLAAPARSLEVPLEYEREVSSIFLLKSAEAPPGEWKLPELKSETPVYLLAHLPGKRRLLVLDRRTGAETFFSRLYYDANGNRDLTDDPAFDANTAGSTNA